MTMNDEVHVWAHVGSSFKYCRKCGAMHRKGAASACPGHVSGVYKAPIENKVRPYLGDGYVILIDSYGEVVNTNKPLRRSLEHVQNM